MTSRNEETNMKTKGYRTPGHLIPLSPQSSADRGLMRAAGWIYLVLILSGIFAGAVVRGSLIAWDSPATTAGNILSSPWLFRIGFVSDMVMILADAALAVLLYLLFRRVSKPLALIATATQLVQSAILGLNLLHYFLAQMVLDGGGTMDAFTADQQASLALLFLDAHAHGYDIALLFFAVHCVILGYLIIKARFIPSFMGVLMSAAGVVYAVGSLAHFLSPQYLDSISPFYLIALVAEGALCLWLLVRAGRLNAAPQ